MRNFVLCIQIHFVSTEKTMRIASRASCLQIHSHSKKIPQIYHKYTTNIPQKYYKM